MALFLAISVFKKNQEVAKAFSELEIGLLRPSGKTQIALHSLVPAHVGQGAPRYHECEDETPDRQTEENDPAKKLEERFNERHHLGQVEKWTTQYRPPPIPTPSNKTLREVIPEEAFGRMKDPANISFTP